MTQPNLQKELFNFIKSAIPPHISMVDAIADLLDISYDSVYRRIRGEKPITLDELKLLCDHFHISLDQAMQLKTDSVVFRDPEPDVVVSNFLEYLEGMLQLLKHFNKFEKREMLYLAKDVPVFYFFLSEELTAFKSFFWSKSILNDPEFENKNFSLKDFDSSKYFSVGRQILDAYNSLDSTELWNYESINSTILQIEYYRDAGIFKTTEDMNMVVTACDKMLEHIQKQVEKGRKFNYGAAETTYKASVKFFINEIILGNNSIMVELDDNKIAFINHIVLKYISTTDKRFTQKLFNNFHNLSSRSALISGTGERDRNKFFKSIRERVMALKR